MEIASGKTIKTLAGHQAPVLGLKLIKEGKVLLSIDSDGVMKFWNLESGKEIYEHIQLSPNEWMVRTPEGYFTGTGKAMQSIHFVKGMKSYQADQFFDTFYRPDLMKTLFEGGSKDRDQSIQGYLQKDPPPKVVLEGSASNDKKTAFLVVKVFNEGGGIEDIRLYHNKKRVETTAKRVFVDSKDTVAYQLELPMLSGGNVFELVAHSKKGIASQAAQVKLKSLEESLPPTCHILAIGINEYQNKQLQLSYAKPDAESVTISLSQKESMPFQDIQVHTLFDKEASRENILAKLEGLSKQIQQQDVFILYYAGHGSMLDEEFYFIPTEMTRLYDKSQLKSMALSAEEVQNKLQQIAALKQLVIMDACQSGASVDVLAKRGVSREKAMAQISRSSGVHILAAAGSEQYATEYEQLGHGLFTYFILEGLKGAADGAPLDGKVTVFELKSYLDNQVPLFSQEHSGKAQYPYTFSKGNDFPLIIVK